MVMTPAERASAVAFSYKNCELSAIAPSEAMVAAANGYQRGTIDLSNFVETPERTTRHRDHDESELRDDRIFARSVRLIDYGWPAIGGLGELKTIHRGLFVGAMNNAGQLRSDSGNGIGDDTKIATKRPDATEGSRTHENRQRINPYFPASLIETGAANIVSQLGEQDYFSGLDRAGFIRALAGVYDELNALHPFAYGNGMVLRMFASELTHAIGWDLDWGSLTFEYRKATDLALFEHDISELERMFTSIIRLANPTRIFLISGWDQGPAH
ncbi:Fic family protein [Bifidobacterium sp. ESL0798]|uniref:Fic family protein n=1 Tax=Bifidobacterium sp. ESL0798 TaxID=2983235 RepID=UPI0023F9EC33|nr:Fic family protein [Bifidobacterium sp. ESL0798]WEV73503.1 Fic family protein [Bifidobacterium sp. ESL0798]